MGLSTFLKNFFYSNNKSKNKGIEASGLPSFLRKFESSLQKYKREYVSINAHPVNGLIHEDNLSLFKSKFGGLPYLPNNIEYPTDEKGNPMLLVAQINFSEIPRLEGFPTQGILQLYLDQEDWYLDGHRILFHPSPNTEKDNQTDYSFLQNCNF